MKSEPKAKEGSATFHTYAFGFGFLAWTNTETLVPMFYHIFVVSYKIYDI